MNLAPLVVVGVVACGGGGGGPDGSPPADATAPDSSPPADATAPDSSPPADATAPDSSPPADATVPPDATAPDAAPVPPDATSVVRAWTSAPAATGLTGDQAWASDGMAIVRGADGVITAAWRRQVPGVGYVELWGGRFTPAAGWAPPVVLADGYDGRAPLLAASAGGHVVIVWQARTTVDGVAAIRAARYTPAGGWGAMVELQGADATFTGDPAVAVDDAGAAVVAWTQGAANIANVWARRQRADGTWEAPALLEHDDSHVDATQVPPVIYHHAYFPRVVVDGDGAATVAWWQGYEGHIAVWSARRAATGAWGARVAVPGGDGGHGVSLAVDGVGVVHAIWTSNLPSTQRELRASRFAGGAWTPSTALAISATSPTDPVMAADGLGAITAAWAVDDGSAYAVRASRYAPGAGWGAAQVIALAGVYAPSPSLGVDAAGAVHVAWLHGAADRGDVYARRFVPASGWQAAELVEVDDGVSASEPHVAVAPDGSAVVMWMMTDGLPAMTTRRTLWVGRYQ
ncbi:MAG: hypothetical protein IPH44_02665 [Myxococcales bacterium]|nr:hypothetical protein [Myxococcales bacterium]MBK7198222.1 hypothetical protein [Myxococcales bacterium]MBP6848512.1 hypothetical protein [Kofleriaceae bacterium]